MKKKRDDLYDMGLQDIPEFKEIIEMAQEHKKLVAERRAMRDEDALSQDDSGPKPS